MIPNDEEERTENKKKFFDLFELSEQKQEEKIQSILSDPNEFASYFQNTFALTYAVISLSEKHVETIIQKILLDEKQFRRLIDDVESLSFILHKFPISFAKKIEFHIFNHPREFDRLILNVQVLYVAISCFPAEFAESFISFILDKRQEFDRLIHSIVPMRYVLRCFPKNYADQFLQRILNDPQIFNNLFNHADSLIYAMMVFSKDIAQQFVQRTGYPLQLQTRTLIVKLRPDFIPTLINVGINPYFPHFGQPGCLGYPDLLHSILSDQPDQVDRYIPLALTLGVDPCPRHLYFDNGELSQSVAKLLITSSKPLSLTKIYTILSLIQHGERADYRDQDKKNILQIIYEQHPVIKNVIYSFGIPKKKLADSEYVLRRINIAILRLEIQYLSSIHQAKNAFINLLILLVMDRVNHQSSSLFKSLPLEMILHILSFVDFPAINKTVHEGITLARYFFSEPEKIKTMLASPGGVNVFQYYHPNDNFSFVLFKSARVLYQDFVKLKSEANQSGVDHHFFSARFRSKEKQDLSLSLKKFYQFREQYGLEGLGTHLSLYKKPSSKLLLLENINYFRP